MLFQQRKNARELHGWTHFCGHPNFYNSDLKKFYIIEHRWSKYCLGQEKISRSLFLTIFLSFFGRVEKVNSCFFATWDDRFKVLTEKFLTKTVLFKFSINFLFRSRALCEVSKNTTSELQFHRRACSKYPNVHPLLRSPSMLVWCYGT